MWKHHEKTGNLSLKDNDGKFLMNKQKQNQHGILATSGRTRTRLPVSAVVHQRWEEGCDCAVQFL